jgi:5'-deoxynucleotidase YfbR-like HD superfamily hydrolase
MNQPKHSNDDVKQAHEYLLALGELTVRFAAVERAPRYPDSHRENDAEHSYHLAISAVELAADYYPELDVGLVAQYSLVHDLPESQVGDTWTFGISEKDRTKKELAEAKATKILLKNLPPHTAQLLERYEQQVEPEARFVRLVDKLLPAIINIMAGDAITFKEDFGLTDIKEYHPEHIKRTAKYQEMFPEFNFIHMVREMISKTSAEHVFRKK